jgi:hypothetical protein
MTEAAGPDIERRFVIGQRRSTMANFYVSQHTNATPQVAPL